METWVNNKSLYSNDHYDSLCLIYASIFSLLDYPAHTPVYHSISYIVLEWLISPSLTTCFLEGGMVEAMSDATQHLE